MNTLTNKRIVLGVTGGIAAYKAAELVRRLRESGAVVRVVMTRSSREFVGPLTFQALSGNPVHADPRSPQRRRQQPELPAHALHRLHLVLRGAGTLQVHERKG